MINVFLTLLLAYSGQPADLLYIQHEGKSIVQMTKEDYFIEEIGTPHLHQDRLHGLINDVDNAVSKTPRDAFIDERGLIVDGKSGYKLNRVVFQENLLQSLYNNGTTRIEASVIQLHPKVDAELLSAIRTKEIGSFVTYFKIANNERTTNITLATEAINNKVVFPGETFSFNKAVGKRTKEKGYLPAPIIVKGELSEGIGGGICQVSSTLFNAVDKAGVHILERYSHSRKVPYVKPGRDATVSWYGPDFTFRNEYNQPLLIRAKVSDGAVAIKIFTSDTNNI
ncbi:VanW family protein [Pseudalkalibacillus hwajinpoensis]|uniref:VanW family protein n=1 Tax=Guptibacillus hwajinpoensis TaxID=208199 RepID=UPI00325BA0E8